MITKKPHKGRHNGARASKHIVPAHLIPHGRVFHETFNPTKAQADGVPSILRKYAKRYGVKHVETIKQMWCKYP